MEAEYGPLFLSGLQHCPPPRGLFSEEPAPATPPAPPGPQPPREADGGGAEGSGPIAAPQPGGAAAAASPGRPLRAEARRCGTPAAASRSPMGGLALTPPPPPAGRLSVGSSVPADVVVIDSLREAKAEDHRPSPQDPDGPGAAFSDDEEPLFNGGASPRGAAAAGAEAALPRGGGRHVADGVDSDSDSDAASPPRHDVAPAKQRAARELEPERPAREAAGAGAGGAAASNAPQHAVAQAPAPAPAAGGAGEPRLPAGGAQVALGAAAGDGASLAERHVSDELGGPPVGRGATASYRVRVPAPYPGVQYRKSKDLEDRYPRYAENGTEVTGVVDGDFLRIGDSVFLPIRVGGVEILEAVIREANTKASKGHAGAPGGALWSCCAGGDFS